MLERRARLGERRRTTMEKVCSSASNVWLDVAALRVAALTEHRQGAIGHSIR